MALIVPDDVVRGSGLSETEFRLEIAVALFRDNHLTLGQASRLAVLSQAEMMSVLAARNIPQHYTLEDLQQDLETLDRLPHR